MSSWDYRNKIVQIKIIGNKKNKIGKTYIYNGYKKLLVDLFMSLCLYIKNIILLNYQKLDLTIGTLFLFNWFWVNGTWLPWFPSPVTIIGVLNPIPTPND